MLIKDKDILAEEVTTENASRPCKCYIKKENMRAAWGDAFDYYIRGITEKYLQFRGRASRLEFWGFMAVSGIVFIPLYLLGDYVHMPLLPYYYLLSTAIPTVAVAARRLHDVNKNAFLYLGLIVLMPLLGLFIGYWAVIPLGLAIVWLIILFSRPTDLKEGVYGAPNPSDEIYGDDNLHIICKFRSISLLLGIILLSLTYIQFDNWSRQAEYLATNDLILERIEDAGKKAGLSSQQIEEAQKVMKNTLKSWNGKVVQPEDITREIEKSLQSARKTEN
ncbi:MAG: DUF805 domain-containing protein [Alphaproteobacteria bacterium]|nr:DUF805 domain-containing protein [Alphaproteobacteria bacterium]